MAGSYPLRAILRRAESIAPSGIRHDNPISVSAGGDYSIEFVECLPVRHGAGLHGRRRTFRERLRLNQLALLRHRLPQSPSSIRHPLEHRLVFKNIARKFGRPILTATSRWRLRQCASRDDVACRDCERSKNFGFARPRRRRFPLRRKVGFIKPDEKKPLSNL